MLELCGHQNHTYKIAETFRPPKCRFNKDIQQNLVWLTVPTQLFALWQLHHTSDSGCTFLFTCVGTFGMYLMDWKALLIGSLFKRASVAVNWMYRYFVFLVYVEAHTEYLKSWKVQILCRILCFVNWLLVSEIVSNSSRWKMFGIYQLQPYGHGTLYGHHNCTDAARRPHRLEFRLPLTVNARITRLSRDASSQSARKQVNCCVERCGFDAGFDAAPLLTQERLDIKSISISYVYGFSFIYFTVVRVYEKERGNNLTITL